MIWSRQIAAALLAAFLDGQMPDLRRYERQVRRELVPELGLAGRLADLFALIPTAYMGLAQHSAVCWRLIGRLARGERTYRDLYRQLGPLTIGIDLASDLLRAAPALQRHAVMQDLPVPGRFLRGRSQSSRADLSNGPSSSDFDRVARSPGAR